MNRPYWTIRAALLAGLAFLAPISSGYAEKDAGPAAAATASSSPQPAPPAETATTRHTLLLPDGEMDYRAVVEMLPHIDDKGETTAWISVVSYMAEGADPATRPVSFVFNGGPGASSAYLNLGALGPRVLVTGPEGAVPAPPARLQDNPASWLAFTDLVFIDPVGAGFSHAVKSGEDAEKPFWSVSGDVNSLSKAIQLWLARQERWQSPKFIVGESYGGFRAAKLAHALSDGPGIALDGLVLVSPALEFFTIGPEEQALLPWALALPSMVASARAHGKGDPTMTLEEVERFALSDYIAGLAALDAPGPGPDDTLVRKVAALLGLEEDFVRRAHGRVSARAFAKRLLREDGLALSLYDGAVAGPDPYPNRRHGPDPQLDATKAPFSTAYNTHIRDELDFDIETQFRLLAHRPSQHWDWEGARGGPGGFRGASDDLAEAMALTPDLGVLVVHGRTDMVTPYMASRWLLDRLDLPDAVRARTRLEVLDGGHMMYLRSDMRSALSEMAAEFYGERAGRRGSGVE